MRDRSFSNSFYGIRKVAATFNTTYKILDTLRFELTINKNILIQAMAISCCGLVVFASVISKVLSTAHQTIVGL